MTGILRATQADTCLDSGSDQKNQNKTKQNIFSNLSSNQFGLFPQELTKQQFQPHLFSRKVGTWFGYKMKLLIHFKREIDHFGELVMVFCHWLIPVNMVCMPSLESRALMTLNESLVSSPEPNGQVSA